MKRRDLDITDARELLDRVLGSTRGPGRFVLDSCGARHLGSRRMLCGVDPVRVVKVSDADPYATLGALDDLIANHPFVMFTLSYDLGLKLNGIGSRHGETGEQDVFAAAFDGVIVYDYDDHSAHLLGHGPTLPPPSRRDRTRPRSLGVTCETARDNYLESAARIIELIRRGITYQTNLTQKIRVRLAPETLPEQIFRTLRAEHPAPFAAFVDRGDSVVISASPERFFAVAGNRISTSPIKGTRPRGTDIGGDTRLREELANSAKDRAENIMIVDLLRNDLGRICKFGSVDAVRLCEVEEHPTLFHLVSTVEGELRPNTRFSEIIAALFPCGSITGAPKISTMRVIDSVEPSRRGLSMGAIGYFAMDGLGDGTAPRADLSVAIRTMVVRDGLAEFNVGGGVVSDSEPDAEYEESVLKAKALLAALGAGHPREL